MPLMIVAGMPQPVLIRSKGFCPSIPGWDVYLAYSRGRKADLQSCWKGVRSVADAAPNDGVHIFAYHHIESERGKFERTVYARHRLVWLERSTLALFGCDEFTGLLSQLACFESIWREQVRPRGTGSALVLPECTFSPSRRFEGIWRRAHRVRIGHDSTQRIAAEIRLFKSHHFLKGAWVDRRRLVFDARGPGHGRTVRSRCWKFTYVVPDGFHYDVQHSHSNTAFTLIDYAGVTRQFRRYTNVDCHGFVRGGS